MKGINREINLLTDIIVQFVIGVYPVLDFYENIWVLLFGGGAWQLASNYLHTRSYNTIPLRKFYWKLVFWLVLISIVTLPIYGIGLFILLFGGIALYIFYFLISVGEFAKVITTTNTENNEK